MYNHTSLTTTDCPIAPDCKAWRASGVNISGVYPIKPDNGSAFQVSILTRLSYSISFPFLLLLSLYLSSLKVYCDMETDGGGWTVFQRRQDGSLDFYRNWADYEEGFGDLKRNFWLGLANIHRLTPTDDSTLRVDLGDFEGNRAFAKYSEFQILNAKTKYTLIVQKYSGNASDSMTYHNAMKFSTKDRDNDLHSSGNCAQIYRGAWWFNYCLYSSLNGQYYNNPTSVSDWHGVMWYHWKGKKYSLKFSEMKVRRNN